MSKLFPNYKINLEKGTVFSVFHGRYLGVKKKDGYFHCKCYDSLGNEYHFIHLVIMAESIQTPITEFPYDENGKRFEVDHILPVSKGGTDSINNLRLVSRLDNANNPQTIANRKLITLGEGNPFYGKHHSEVSKKKISNGRKGKPSPRKGKHHTDEAKKKMSEAHKGLPSYAAKPLDQIDKVTGEVLRTWNSAAETARELGFDSKKISACANGYPKYKTHKGFVWKKHLTLPRTP